MPEKRNINKKIDDYVSSSSGDFWKDWKNEIMQDKKIADVFNEIDTDKNKRSEKKLGNNKFGGSGMMKKFFGDFYFGPVKNAKFKMSPLGVAMKQKDGAWVCYDPKKDSVTNVAEMIFDMDDMFYQIPVNVVHPGDLILHKGDPVYVKEIITNDAKKGSRISCYHCDRNEEIIIYPEKSIMGNFLFFSKIISIMSLMGVTSDDPNGMDITKMNPMMFMFMGNDSDGEGMFGGKFKDIMMMQMMSGMFKGDMDGTNINQLLPILMFSGNQDMDMFEMMMMMQMMGNGNTENPMMNMMGAIFPQDKKEKPARGKK